LQWTLVTEAEQLSKMEGQWRPVAAEFVLTKAPGSTETCQVLVMVNIVPAVSNDPAGAEKARDQQNAAEAKSGSTAEKAEAARTEAETPAPASALPATPDAPATVAPLPASGTTPASTARQEAIAKTQAINQMLQQDIAENNAEIAGLQETLRDEADSARRLSIQREIDRIQDDTQRIQTRIDRNNAAIGA
jgi:hypothetical protein